MPEPEGGAHWNYDEAAQLLKEAIIRNLNEVKNIPAKTRMEQRIEKFGKMGFWEE